MRTLLLSACYSETFVLLLQWDVQLTNWHGAAITNAPLHGYAWSDPHSRLDAEIVYRSNAAGRISAAERLSSKMTAPLMLYGVSYNYLSFCVSAPGYRMLVGTLENLELSETLTLTLPLTSGESAPVCNDYERLHTPRGTASGHRRPKRQAQWYLRGNRVDPSGE